MTGLGMHTDLCMIGYSLVLAMNYLPGMAVITLNVISDAATNVIVNFKEGVLNKEVYNKTYRTYRDLYESLKAMMVRK